MDEYYRGYWHGQGHALIAHSAFLVHTLDMAFFYITLSLPCIIVWSSVRRSPWTRTVGGVTA